MMQRRQDQSVPVHSRVRLMKRAWLVVQHVTAIVAMDFRTCSDATEDRSCGGDEATGTGAAAAVADAVCLVAAAGAACAACAAFGAGNALVFFGESFCGDVTCFCEAGDVFPAAGDFAASFSFDGAGLKPERGVCRYMRDGFIRQED